MIYHGKQTNVRLPCELKAWLARQAEAQRRSLTNEIILRLEESRARQRRIQTNRPTME